MADFRWPSWKRERKVIFQQTGVLLAAVPGRLLVVVHVFRSVMAIKSTSAFLKEVLRMLCAS